MKTVAPNVPNVTEPSFTSHVYFTEQFAMFGATERKVEKYRTSRCEQPVSLNLIKTALEFIYRPMSTNLVDNFERIKA